MNTQRKMMIGLNFPEDDCLFYTELIFFTSLEKQFKSLKETIKSADDLYDLIENGEIQYITDGKPFYHASEDRKNSHECWTTPDGYCSIIAKLYRWIEGCYEDPAIQSAIIWNHDTDSLEAYRIFRSDSGDSHLTSPAFIQRIDPK